MVNREKLLAFFREKTRRPMRFKEIVSAMGLSSSESRALKRILRGMLRSGEIVLTKKGHYGPSEDMDLVTGYFEAHREGYGFVVPEKPGERDLFVPARAAMSAMDGDMVVVRTENRAKRLGRIVRILDRAHTRVAGRVEISKEGFYVRPKSRSIPFVIYIPPGKRGGAKDGQTVVVEITEYSVGLRPAAGKVMKIIREADEPKAVVEAIIEEFSLPRRFPSRVRTEAKSLYGAKGFGKRKDLRSLNTVTIDGERAKDFDDAVSVELREHGYTLWVHIADVGFYLGWDTPLDIEARKRATSVYFPDRVIPMLPKELSEDLCSLRPKVDRPAFTVEMDFDRTGNRLDARFYPSLIKSDERMTYTSVRKILVDEDPKERKKYDYLLHDFDLMGELTSVLRQKTGQARGDFKGGTKLRAPNDRGVHDCGQRGCGRAPFKAWRAVALQDTRGAGPRKGGRGDEVRGRLCPSGEEARPEVLPQGAARGSGQARGRGDNIHGPAEPQAGPLLPGKRGPLRPGLGVLYAFHVAHKALPRPRGTQDTQGGTEKETVVR
jgi:ribonuclease R